MRAKRPTEQEIRRNFDECLKDAVELGVWPPSSQGFDEYVDKTLRQIAKSYPNIRSDQVASARTFLDGQFDGSNEDRRERELAARRPRRS